MNPSNAHPGFDTLPSLSPRPAQATDYTGRQRGKMTAIAWYRASRSGKGTLWLCRCECGRYEYRRPGTWAARPHPEDRCEAWGQGAQRPADRAQALSAMAGGLA